MLRQTEEGSIKTREDLVNGRMKKDPRLGPYQVVPGFGVLFGVLALAYQ